MIKNRSLVVVKRPKLLQGGICRKELNMKTFFDFSVKDANGKDIHLEQYKNNVVLVVNVASKCGFTPQYKGLEALNQEYKNENFVILGFPCNQFGAQEPGTSEEIQTFCETNYGVTFPVLGKIDVNGANADPMYKHIKSESPGILGTEAIKWNFTKFLIGKNGHVIDRFAPNTEPKDISPAIKQALKN